MNEKSEIKLQCNKDPYTYSFDSHCVAINKLTGVATTAGNNETLLVSIKVASKILI